MGTAARFVPSPIAMARRRKRRADYDSPWKEVIERFLEAFFRLFYPRAHPGIDWSRGVEFLDKELQKIVPRANVGRRTVDKLIQVWTVDGRSQMVLVHIDVQGKKEPRFAYRMFVYHYRIHDRYGKPVASFALLTDGDPSWRPHSYSSEVLGCELRLGFNTTKLLDFEKEALRADPNPFSLVALATLEALETAGRPVARFEAKTDLVRELFRRGYNADEAWQLMRFLDWVCELPPELEEKFQEVVREIDQEGPMRYVAPFERKAHDQGLERGRRDTLIALVRRRFGEEAAGRAGSVLERIAGSDDIGWVLDLVIASADAQAFLVALEDAHRSRS